MAENERDEFVHVGDEMAERAKQDSLGFGYLTGEPCALRPAANSAGCTSHSTVPTEQRNGHAPEGRKRAVYS
jgi:hypothetical protein